MQSPLFASGRRVLIAVGKLPSAIASAAASVDFEALMEVENNPKTIANTTAANLFGKRA